MLEDHIIALEVSYIDEKNEKIVADEHYFKDWTASNADDLREKVMYLGAFDDFLKISGTSNMEEVINVQFITDTGKGLTLNPSIANPRDTEVRHMSIKAGLKLSYLSGAFVRQGGMVKLRYLEFVLRNTLDPI